MAPRDRTRKRRLTRMDAAIDAMTPYGFSENLTRKIARELLKEYGGDEAWFFIEQDSYEVLREALLRDVEENDREKSAQDENHMKNESKDETQAEACGAATDSPQDAEIPDNAPEDAVGSSSVVQLAFAEGVSISSGIDSAEENGRDWKDIGLDQCDDLRTGKGSIPSPLMIPSPIPTPKRRGPCYGWLESDDENDPNDIISFPVQVESTPAVENFSRVRTNLKAKRKSRWDVKPDDP